MEKTLLSFWCERIAKLAAEISQLQSFDDDVIREIGNLIADRPHLDKPEFYNPPDDALLEVVESLSAIKDSFMDFSQEELYSENKYQVESLKIFCASMIDFLKDQPLAESETVVGRLADSEDTKVINIKKITGSAGIAQEKAETDDLYGDTIRVAQRLFENMSFDQLELLVGLIRERLDRMDV